MIRAEQKVVALVYIYDHLCVDYKIDVPDSLKFEKLLPSVLEQYAPSFSVRASNVAFTICFNVYQKQNPDSTLEDFQTNFLTTAAGVTAYQEALNQVGAKIKQKITVEDIESLYRKQSPATQAS